MDPPRAAARSVGQTPGVRKEGPVGLDQTALAGTSALVTGGGSGIGLACAQRLAADGASVTICGRSEDRLRAGIETIEAAIAASGHQAVKVQAVPTDVTDEPAMARAVGAATALTGRLGAVV